MGIRLKFELNPAEDVTCVISRSSRSRISIQMGLLITDLYSWKKKKKNPSPLLSVLYLLDCIPVLPVFYTFFCLIFVMFSFYFSPFFLVFLYFSLFFWNIELSFVVNAYSLTNNARTEMVIWTIFVYAFIFDSGPFYRRTRQMFCPSGSVLIII